MVNPTCLSFVSGKGGVGKTMLAANVAWQCSRVARTLLMDLDFHNQGASKLMAPHFHLRGADSFNIITDYAAIREASLISISDGLYFMPAVSWTSRPSTDMVVNQVHGGHFGRCMQRALLDLCVLHDVQIVVLDCHGGLDPVSYSAHRLSDVTFMITEADSVTFAGTLELLQYYDEERNDHAEIVPHAGGMTETSVPMARPNIRFIVNRLPSKFSLSSLERLYQPYFAEHFGRFSRDRSVFCYIPTEELLSESFGEYPFHVQIAPSSIYTRKVRSICYHTLNDKLDVSRALELTWYENRRRSERVRREVLSQEQKNVGAVMNFFAGASILIVLLLISTLVLAGVHQLTGDVRRETVTYVIATIGIAAGVPTTWFFIKAMIGIMLYFRGRHLYQKRLFKALRRRMSVWQWLALIQSYALRWSTTVGLVIIALYGIVTGGGILFFL